MIRWFNSNREIIACAVAAPHGGWIAIVPGRLYEWHAKDELAIAAVERCLGWQQ